jgi:ferredoxin
MKTTAFYGILLISLFSITVFAAKKVAFINQKTCIQCGTCAKNCPVKAIGKVEKDGKTRYVVDPKKCIACGTCVKNCPTKSISLYDENAVPQADTAKNIDATKKADTTKKIDTTKSLKKEKS